MNPIPLFKMSVTAAETDAAHRVLSRGTAWAVGPEIKEFERAVAAYVGTRECVALSSGTSALHLMLLAYGIGPGDEVVVPSFTFIATANAVALCGARPVFADVEPRTLALDPADVERRITPRTKAIMPIHYSGAPCRVRELRRLADARGVLLLEDAAQAFGATVGGRQAGTFGQAAALSFCQNKVITTAGEGGAVVTDDERLAARMRELRSHGRVETRDYFTSVHDLDYVAAGFNYRMSSVQAAVGAAQLARVEELVRARREVARAYDDALARVPGVSTMRVPDGERHVYQMYTVTFDDPRAQKRVSDHLMKAGVACKVYFSPAHLATYYRAQGWKEGDLPVTEDLSRRVLSIPMYPGLPREDAARVAAEVAAAMKQE